MNISPESILIESLAINKKRITVHLRDGRVVSNPLEWYPRLAKATQKQRLAFEMSGGGYAVHWPELDEDLSAEGLAHGIPSSEFRKATMT